MHCPIPEDGPAIYFTATFLPVLSPDTHEQVGVYRHLQMMSRN